MGGDRRIPSYGGEYRYAREDKDVDVRLLLFESFGGFGKGVGEILWGAANVLQNKLTRAQYLDEVTWTTKSWLGLQKQRISVVLHTAIAEQIVNELASGEGGRVHGAKCLFNKINIKISRPHHPRRATADICSRSASSPPARPRCCTQLHGVSSQQPLRREPGWSRSPPCRGCACSTSTSACGLPRCTRSAVHRFPATLRVECLTAEGRR